MPKSKSTPSYITKLSMEERAAAMRFGAMLAFQQHGIPLSAADTVVKRAFSAPSIGGALEGTSKAIVAVSLLTGVPLGIAAHAIGKRVSADRKAERERLARIKYYRDITRQLDSGLSGIPESKINQ